MPRDFVALLDLVSISLRTPPLAFVVDSTRYQGSGVKVACMGPAPYDTLPPSLDDLPFDDASRGWYPRRSYRVRMGGFLMRRIAAIAVVLALLVGGCHRYLSSEVWEQYEAGTVYTCCNLHYEDSRRYASAGVISDANYYVGTMLPLGTPVTLKDSGHGWVSFDATGTWLTLDHGYGTNAESFQQYVEKVFVRQDPKIRLVRDLLPRRSVCDSTGPRRGRHDARASDHLARLSPDPSDTVARQLRVDLLVAPLRNLPGPVRRRRKGQHGHRIGADEVQSRRVVPRRGAVSLDNATVRHLSPRRSLAPFAVDSTR